MRCLEFLPPHSPQCFLCPNSDGIGVNSPLNAWKALLSFYWVFPHPQGFYFSLKKNTHTQKKTHLSVFLKVSSTPSKKQNEFSAYPMLNTPALKCRERTRGQFRSTSCIIAPQLKPSGLRIFKVILHKAHHICLLTKYAGGLTYRK